MKCLAKVSQRNSDAVRVEPQMKSPAGTASPARWSPVVSVYFPMSSASGSRTVALSYLAEAYSPVPQSPVVSV